MWKSLAILSIILMRMEEMNFNQKNNDNNNKKF